MGSIFGLIKEHMMGSGRKTRCMGKVYLHELTGGGMRENM